MSLLLAGCTAAPQSTPSAPTVEPANVTPSQTASPSATATPSPTSSKSVRGNVVKKPGEPAWIKNNDGSLAVTLVVKSIQVDPVCTSGVTEKPKNGHLVALDVDVETTPALAAGVIKTFSFAGSGWKVIADNGTTVNGEPINFEAFSCFPEAERLPVSIGPAEKATGKVVLDVPTPTGVLVNDAERAGGWEWAYPAVRG